jgi:ADP-ribosyl-[dinitrogen reductase] hydrolase
MYFFSNFFSKLRMGEHKTENNQKINEPFTLEKLLNEPQPYNELKRLQDTPLTEADDNEILRRMQGSLVGLAVGDALGASVEFRPNAYMQQHPVSDMLDGGTWGLKAGQWTDDTSMALCLAASLIVKGGFDGYDQLVRYKWWYRKGYMSSTGTCFDIGSATRQAIVEFEKRQRQCAEELQTKANMTIPDHSLDQTIAERLSQIDFDTKCGAKDANGNGPLMRLAPIPLFYFRSAPDAIQFAGTSASLTHGGKKAIDACRFYSALICSAINGVSKQDLLDKKIYREHFKARLDEDVMKIIEGSYKEKDGYEGGIRGKGFILNALEAALWAFYNDEDSFEKGVLLAVNLGDDTDTTAAIYGQLAGAVYGIDGIPQRWRDRLFQTNFLITLANGLYLKGKNFNRQKRRADVVEDVTQNDRPISTRTRGGAKKAKVISEN